MARANKRTSAVLGALAVVFIIIIIILCIVPKGGSPPDDGTQEKQKSKDITGVITDTTTTTTATTTTTTTATTTTSTTPEPPIATTTPTTTSEATTPEPAASPTTTTTTTTEPTTLVTDTTTTTTLVADTTTTTTPGPTILVTDASATTTPEATDASATTTPEATDATVTSTPEPTTVSSTVITTTPEPSTPLTNTSDTATSEPTTTPGTTITTGSTGSTPTTLESVTEESTTDLMSTSEITTQGTTNGTSPPTTSEPTTTFSPTTTPEPTTSVTKPVTTTFETTETGPTTTTSMPPTSSSCQSNMTCNNPACKTTAANMLAMMDHREGVDPCQDFYQYACGGMMENPFLGAKNPRVIAESLIRDLLETTDPDTTTNMGKMRIFYDSCLNAVDQDDKESWNQTLTEVFGQHRFEDSSPVNLTDMLTHMMAYDFTPFFDMSLDVKRDASDEFSFTLHPTVPSSAFSEDLARKVCLEEHHRRLEHTDYYDVAEEYEAFTECVHRGSGLEARLERMEEAVQRFGLLDHLGNTSHSILQDSKNKARSFLEELSEVLPSVPSLKEDLRNKNNNPVKVTELDSSVIKWEGLIQHLAPGAAIPTEKVLTYKMDELLEMLEVLEKHEDEDPRSLRNVLLMMWSEKLYTDFVKPVRGNVGGQEYCLHAAITLMPGAASALYLDGLSPEEVEARKAQTKEMTASIKRAGKKELKGRDQDSVRKLEYMLDNAIQDVSSDINDPRKQLPQLSTSGFFDNCLQLLKHRRTLTYQMYFEMPEEEPLWFMQPYNPSGRHIYARSQITIPYAAQEDSNTFKNLPKYLSYAGIGHMISHLVMHGYDTSGVAYQNMGIKALNDQTYYIEKMEDLTGQYTAPQSYISRDVTANITMTTLASNELLAHSGATKLAWEAYLMRNDVDPTKPPPQRETNSAAARRRRRSSPLDTTGRTKRQATSPSPPLDTEEKPLPWLGLTPIQLYFLHWSQHQCSASGGMGLLELMESEQPPARMRVNLVLQNEPLFNKAFNCHPRNKESPFTLG